MSSSIVPDSSSFELDTLQDKCAGAAALNPNAEPAGIDHSDRRKLRSSVWLDHSDGNKSERRGNVGQR